LVRDSPILILPPSASKIIKHIKNETRQENEDDWAFAKNYLPGALRLPPSIMHKEVSLLLKQIISQRGKRLAIAEPCDYGLSDLICLAYVLASICYERESFIVIISPAFKNAKEVLETIKTELISNDVLQKDFPEATGKKEHHWRSNEITTRNGIKLMAAGLNQRKHSYRYKDRKPSLIILDNIDDGVECVFPEHRDGMHSKFKGIIDRNCNRDTNVVATGTILCHYSILAGIIIKGQQPGWIGKRYAAVSSWATNLRLWSRWQSIYFEQSPYFYEKGPIAAKRFFEDHKDAMLAGSKVLWSEHEDYYQLMEYRLAVGERDFASHRQNKPHSPDRIDIDPLKVERLRQGLKAWEAKFAREGRLTILERGY
jgi:hypothetical protein